MDHPRLVRPAPLLAVIIIAGLVGGILFGITLNYLQKADELGGLRTVVKSSVIGFYLGVLGVILVVLTNRKMVESTRGLAAVVAVIAFISWLFMKVLIQAIG